MNHQILAAASNPSVLGGIWLPAVVLAQLYVIFFVYLAWSVRRLPVRVASQFSLFGRPQHYMSRAVYLIFIGVLGVVLPLSGLISHYAIMAHPESFHIPHREYWLAPEHLAETRAYMLQFWLWFACLLVAFLTGVHFVILRANRREPAQLPWVALLVLLAFLGGGIAVGVTAMDRHFSHIGQASANSKVGNGSWTA